MLPLLLPMSRTSMLSNMLAISICAPHNRAHFRVYISSSLFLSTNLQFSCHLHTFLSTSRLKKKTKRKKSLQCSKMQRKKQLCEARSGRPAALFCILKGARMFGCFALDLNRMQWHKLCTLILNL